MADFEVRRDDFATTRVVRGEDQWPAEGQVLVEVERFGFSANNITYARLGDQMRYWSLFPSDDGWGRIPAWGYLRVVASGVPGIDEGRRAYGMCPMSTHLLMTPARVTGDGFVDTTGSRPELSAVYNAYGWLDTDAAHLPTLEDHLLVLRPVFWLSFLIEDQLSQRALLSGNQALITSASSRAAIGLAHLLAGKGTPTVGLTSLGQRDFVERLAIYDAVHTYEEIGSLPRGPSVLVDIAGAQSLRQRVANQLGRDLTHTLVAGFTHGTDEAVHDGSVFLFAPDLIVERARQRGWSELNRDYAHRLRDFATWSQDWLRVAHRCGVDAVEAVYRDVLGNTAATADAHVLTLSPVPD